MPVPKTMPEVKHKFKEYLGTENDPPSVSVADYFKARSSSNIGASVSRWSREETVLIIR